MEVVSVNVGLPRAIEWQGRIVETSIYKEPVSGRVKVTRLNLEGDRQASPAVHGGVNRAVYVYPAEHYAFWTSELPGQALPWGAFGENLTTSGLTENDVCIGDRLQAGSAEFVVTQPRMPCFKLSMRFEVPGLDKHFLRSGRTGFFLAVTREGDVGPGDGIFVIHRHPEAITVTDVVRSHGA